MAMHRMPTPAERAAKNRPLSEIARGGGWNEDIASSSANGDQAFRDRPRPEPFPEQDRQEERGPMLRNAGRRVKPDLMRALQQSERPNMQPPPPIEQLDQEDTAPRAAKKPTFIQPVNPEDIPPHMINRGPSKFDDEEPVAAKPNKKLTIAYAVTSIKPEVTSAMELIDLPSQFIPYDNITAIHVRRLSANDVSQLFAAMNTRSMSKFLDVLARTMDVDIRLLTVQDFYHIIYWQRMTSFVRSPHTVSWKSRYGNKNKLEVDSSNLVINQIQLSKEEYGKWRELGISHPLVRDMELFYNFGDQMDDDTKAKWGRAQYIRQSEDDDGAGDTYDSKMAAYTSDSLPASFLEDVRDFVKAADFGVQNFIMARDQHFNPHTALEALEQRLIELRALQIDDEFEDILSKLVEEHDAIEAALEKGEEQNIGPALDRVEIDVGLFNFFPQV